MTVSQFVQNIKRRCQVSDVSTTTDQVTTDIINFLNNRMYQIWRMWPWDWLWVAISFNTVINQTDYSLASNVGGIVFIGNSSGGRFRRRNIKEYRDWLLINKLDPVTGAPIVTSGQVSDYVIIGRDSSGNIQVRLWEPPATVISVVGFGKQRITAHAVADIASGIAINYFPVEFHDILEDGVASDIYETIGKKQESEISESEFHREIEQLKGEEDDNEDLDTTTQLPDYVRFMIRNNAGTTVA